MNVKKRRVITIVLTCIIGLLFVCVALAKIKPSPDNVNDKVEINFMSVGSSDGGKLKHGQVGVAIIHFTNLTDKSLEVPLEPIPIGKGRMKHGLSGSYRSPNQGSDSGKGWGYSSGSLLPEVRFRFEDKKGNTVYEDYPVLIPNIPLIKPNSWQHTTCLFRCPDTQGIYNLRIIINTTQLSENPGFNVLPEEKPGVETIYLDETVILTDILVD